VQWLQLTSYCYFYKKEKKYYFTMEFPFDINIILPHEITILNGDYRILNHGQTARIL
jgi:hypothetical protein